jgi:hypothetical protein
MIGPEFIALSRFGLFAFAIGFIYGYFAVRNGRFSKLAGFLAPLVSAVVILVVLLIISIISPSDSPMSGGSRINRAMTQAYLVAPAIFIIGLLPSIGGCAISQWFFLRLRRNT